MKISRWIGLILAWPFIILGIAFFLAVSHAVSIRGGTFSGILNAIVEAQVSQDRITFPASAFDTLANSGCQGPTFLEFPNTGEMPFTRAYWCGDDVNNELWINDIPVLDTANGTIDVYLKGAFRRVGNPVGTSQLSFTVSGSCKRPGVVRPDITSNPTVLNVPLTVSFREEIGSVSLAIPGCTGGSVGTPVTLDLKFEVNPAAHDCDGDDFSLCKITGAQVHVRS